MQKNKKRKTYSIWALVRRRNPTLPKEEKWEERVPSEPMDLDTATKALTKANSKKTSEIKGGIEYQTSYFLRRNMEHIQNILPTQFAHQIEPEAREDEYEEIQKVIKEELGETEFETDITGGIETKCNTEIFGEEIFEEEEEEEEEIKKKYPEDPIVLIPSSTLGEPAEITTTSNWTEIATM